MPKDVCLKWMRDLNMCTSDPANPIEFRYNEMDYGGLLQQDWIFCLMGVDIDKGVNYEFGETWRDLWRFRQKKRR
jgi:hypothetical protein